MSATIRSDFARSASASSDTRWSTSPGSARKSSWASKRPAVKAGAASHRTFLHKLTLLIAFFPAIVLSSGCAETKQKWTESRRTPKQWLDVALESNSADERRRAVEEISKSRDATSDWAVMAFESIARTDVDPTVRVAALRGLKLSMGPQTVPLLLKLLRTGEPPKDVRAAPAIVRWEAAELLGELARRGDVDAAQRADAADVLIQRADHDDDRNVRIAALDALGGFREQKTLIALISALRERDFAIQSAAERSLTALTGQSHNYDADEWNAWLSKTPDPFANAQAAPPSDAERRSWWSRMTG